MLRNGPLCDPRTWLRPKVQVGGSVGGPGVIVQNSKVCRAKSLPLVAILAWAGHDNRTVVVVHCLFVLVLLFCFSFAPSIVATMDSDDDEDDSSLDDEDQHFRSSPGLSSSFLSRPIIVSAPLASAHFLSSPSFRSSWMLVNPLPFIASSKASSQGFARAPCWQAWTWMEARQAQAMRRTTLRLKWCALASRRHIWHCLI